MESASLSVFSPSTLALAVGLALLLPVSAMAQQAPAANIAEQNQRYTFNIAAKPLPQALAEFSAVTGLQVLFIEQSVFSQKAPALNGSFSAQEALKRLTAGSGMLFRFSANGVTLEKAPQQQADGPLVLGAVTVTADKHSSFVALPTELGYRPRYSSATGYRALPVLDTPSSVSSFPAELLRDQQARTLAEVIKNDASVSLAGDPHWFERVNVRGFHLSTNAIYRDGFSINDQGSIALENKAAVEVNKGLSALRYGATSPGGTINYAIKRPTAEALRDVHLSANGYGGFGLHVDIGGRFGSEAAFGYRFNVASEELRTHVDAFKGDKQFISAFLDWNVSDQFTLELDVEHQRIDKLNVRGPQLWWWGWDEDAEVVAAAQAVFHKLSPETYTYQSWAMEPNEQTYVVGRANYSFSQDWSASLSVHRSELWRDQNASGVWDVVQANGDYETSIYYAPDQERNNTGYQLIFKGDLVQGSLLHEIAFGYDQIQRDMTFPDGVYKSIGFDNLFNPKGVPRPNLNATDAGPSYLANRAKQQAFFVIDNIIINEYWRVYGGLRHTTIQQYAGGTATTAPSKNYDQSATNPTLGVVYKPVAVASIYVSYTEGIEQGGIVGLGGARPYTNARSQLSPLKSQQIEAGVKWEVGNDALITAALFDIDKGLEIDRDNGNNTRTRVQNGRQAHRGIKLTASGQLTPRLNLVAGLAYLDATIKKTSNTTLIGKRPSGIPDWQANFYADYYVGSYIPGLSVNAGIYYGGKKAIDTGNIWYADNYVRLDVGAKYVHTLVGGQQLTYRLTVDNLTNKQYLESTTWSALQFGAPRSVRMSVNVSF